ncbi:hypothetical protein LJC56_02610 [Christensenellaceae bacterium OttesenSCG-928-K19]|nr:hypothetical protein [Christensenellaceae bacterium OttesenSCG-928-K19]
MNNISTGTSIPNEKHAPYTADGKAYVASAATDLVTTGTFDKTVYGWVTCTPEKEQSTNFASYTMNYNIASGIPEEMKNYMVSMIDRFSTFGSTTMFNAFSKHGLEPNDITLSFTGKGLKYSFSGFNTKTLDVVELVRHTMDEINFINKMEQNAQNEQWLGLLKKYC